MRINAKALKERGLTVRTFIDGSPVKQPDDVTVEITGHNIALPAEFCEFIRDGFSSDELPSALLEGFAARFNQFLILEAITQTEHKS